VCSGAPVRRSLRFRLRPPEPAPYGDRWTRDPPRGYRRVMRFRARRGYRWIDLVLAVLWCAIAVQALVSGALYFGVLFILGGFSGLVGLALRTWVYGVTFTTDAAVIQGIRRRTMPRAGITEMATREWRGADRIVLTGPQGPIRRPVPVTGPFTFDAAFNAKARAIRDWTTSGRLETTVETTVDR
jgi:hypothetical protein